MTKEKKIDCVKLKREWHQKALEESGAKNIDEYADYANKMAAKSPLRKYVEHISI